jgi:DNA-binding NarL/FixJ family response regulator
MCSGQVPKDLSVLLFDSNQMQSQLLVAALRRRSEFRVSACAMEADAILPALQTGDFDVAVFCVQRTGDAWQDLAAIRRAKLACPKLDCIVLTDENDRDLVLQSFRSGARGIFCYSEQSFRMLCRCIRCVHQGQIWANARQMQYLVESVIQVPSLRVVNANGANLLTPREEQVVALVADGLSNRAVGTELNLSEHTVKKYLFRIFEKLGISTRVELVLYAVSQGNRREAEWIPAGS